jgi:hypothetical protein
MLDEGIIRDSGLDRMRQHEIFIILLRVVCYLKLKRQETSITYFSYGWLQVIEAKESIATGKVELLY